METIAGVVNDYVLDEPEREAMAALSTRAARHLHGDPAEVVDLLDLVPEGIRSSVRSFALGSTSGFFVLRGLDVGALPRTPESHGPTVLRQHLSSGALMLAAELLGSLVGYADEKHGDLIHDVHPVRGEETRIENTGSVDFDFHTENVHHPLRPDFLGLLCLRQDHAGVAATRVASVREAVSRLEAWTVSELRQAQFHSLYPTSFTRAARGERPVCGPHPILFGYEDGLFMRFNSHNTQAVTARGTAAIRDLSEALESVSHDLVLEPGELVLIDNHVAAHGRSGFTARYDGFDRWLRRCYSLRSIPRWACGMMRRPRVLPPMADIAGVV